jgi:hypothetical protein
VPKCCTDKSCQNYNPTAYSDDGTCVLKTAMFNDQYRKDVDIARCFSWFLQDLVHYRILSCLVSCIGYWGLESFTKCISILYPVLSWEFHIIGLRDLLMKRCWLQCQHSQLVNYWLIDVRGAWFFLCTGMKVGDNVKTYCWNWSWNSTLKVVHDKLTENS